MKEREAANMMVMMKGSAFNPRILAVEMAKGAMMMAVAVLDRNEVMIIVKKNRIAIRPMWPKFVPAAVIMFSICWAR